MESGRHTAVTSTILLMELAFQAWQMGRQVVALEHGVRLLHFSKPILADVTRDVARRAARIRARFNARPADALHVATALAHGASDSVTNDRRLRGVESLLDMLILDEFTPP